ncbi:MAG: hypothetical protein NTY51_07655 [Deltaproteobacteria bacterium]|nr:hypothetical protein [Deltaproteobacteria bacterium]
MGHGFPERRFDGFASLVVKEAPGPCAAGHLLIGKRIGINCYELECLEISVQAFQELES